MSMIKKDKEKPYNDSTTVKAYLKDCRKNHFINMATLEVFISKQLTHIVANGQDNECHD